MKKTTLTLAASLLLCTGSAYAQTSSDATANSDVTSRAYMERMDTNKDGSVTQAEYEAFMNDAFAKLDKNQDGNLDKEELAKVTTPEQFGSTDTDGNGTISKAEFHARVMKDFAEADTDSDGILR